jgi:hypothetical protein
VRDGVSLLRGWTGMPVVSHRAGDYGADERTLQALARSGILVDSSLFAGNPRSFLNGLGMPANLPSRRGGVVQVPVTVYRRDTYPLVGSTLASPVSSIRKIDPDWFLDANEATAAIDALVDSRIPYVVVFLHSFSLLSPSDAGEPPSANLRSLRTLHAILDHVRSRGLPVVTMSQVAQAGASGDAAIRDVIPAVPVRVGVHRYAWARARQAGRPLLVGAGVFAASGAVALVWLALRHFRGRAEGAAARRVPPLRAKGSA